MSLNACTLFVPDFLQELVESATLLHERFAEVLEVPLTDFLRMLLIKKVNGFGHKGVYSLLP